MQQLQYKTDFLLTAGNAAAAPPHPSIKTQTLNNFIVKVFRLHSKNVEVDSNESKGGVC